MSRFNVFEGSRRIALLLKILWVIGVVVVAYMNTPSVYLYFAADTPRSVFRITEDNCEISNDAVEFISREVEPGKTVSVELCFKSQLFESNQRRLVPYRIDSVGIMWGNEPYSTEVSTYTKSRAEQFALSDAARQIALRKWKAQRRKDAWYAFLFATGGWIVLSLLQALIGWIVRGFAGIPRGHDRVPDSAEG